MHAKASGESRLDGRSDRTAFLQRDVGSCSSTLIGRFLRPPLDLLKDSRDILPGAVEHLDKKPSEPMLGAMVPINPVPDVVLAVVTRSSPHPFIGEPFARDVGREKAIAK